MSLDSVVARTLSVTLPNGTTKTVRLRLYRPVRVASMEWRCLFTVTAGRKVMHGGEAFGIDGLQAIINATQAARGALSRLGTPSFVGVKGMTGIPLAVPDLFDPKIAAHLESVVARELTRITRRLARKGRSRGR